MVQEAVEISQAIADRITFRCTLIQTGTESYRFQATAAGRTKTTRA